MFIKLTARLFVNVHELNNEASVGTFTDIRKIKLVNSKNEVNEVTAISGNMLKRYHFVYVKRLLEQMGYDKFCQYCKREESWRLASEDTRLKRPEKKAKKASERMKASLESFIESEKNIITSCAIEDIHGYLSPIQGFPIKRDSRVRFSWLVPCEDSQEAVVTVLHNRVAKVLEIKPEKPEGEKSSEEEASVQPEGKKSSEEKKKEDKEEAVQMMAFYKQYASAIYAFSSSIDLGRIGVSDYTMKTVEGLKEDELNARKLATLKAYMALMQGETGASLSRALPIVKPLECLIIASEFPALPNLVSSYYTDYKEENLKLLKSLENLVTQPIYVIGGPEQAYKNLESAFIHSSKIKFIEAESSLDAIAKLNDLILGKQSVS
ncbi:MAG: DevR family CRISPR-associated autoregulator [Nitrososphaeria archaeon]